MSILPADESWGDADQWFEVMIAQARTYQSFEEILNPTVTGVGSDWTSWDNELARQVTQTTDTTILSY